MNSFLSGQEGTAAQTATRHVCKLTIESFLINVFRLEAHCWACWCHPSSSSCLIELSRSLRGNPDHLLPSGKPSSCSWVTWCFHVIWGSLRGWGMWTVCHLLLIMFVAHCSESFLSPEKNGGRSHSRISTWFSDSHMWLSPSWGGDGAQTRQLWGRLYEGFTRTLEGGPEHRW